MKSQFQEFAAPSQSSGTIIALPGGPGLSTDTLPLNFLCDSFRVLLLNPPGCGTVDQPDFEGLTRDAAYRTVVQSLVCAIKEVTDRPEPVILLGHSYGGIMMADVLAHLPQRSTYGLALMASPFTEYLYSSVLQQQMNYYADDHFHRSREDYFRSPSLSRFHDYATSYGRMLASRDGRSLELILKLLREDRSCAESMARSTKSFNRDPDYEARLTGFSNPRLVITGSEDYLLPLEQVRNECRRLGLRMVSIARAGHFPHIDASLCVKQSLLELSRQIPSS